MKHIITLILVALISISSCISQDKSVHNIAFIHDTIKAYPKAVGYVSDFEDILSIEEERYLDSLISNYREISSNEIALVTVKSISPYESIEDFTTDLGNHWGVGQAGKDNGLVIAVSKNLRQVFIGTGIGTEKVLSDKAIKKIIDADMVPSFRSGLYFDGIKKGILVLMDQWK